MSNDNKDTQPSSEELLQALLGGAKQRSGKQEAKEHKFWDHQPVPKLNEQLDVSGPIDPIKTVDEVRDQPYKLPGDAFQWCDCDLTDMKVLDEVYHLLNANYVEDDDNMFRFDYSREFLQWALLPPGYRTDWHVCVRAKATGKMVAFITGIPATTVVYGKSIEMVEINFLCIHKKLRNKRLAPMLIREITRRVNRTDRWQAVYTAGVVLPKPVAKNRYYHRSLNPKKLISVGFSHLPSHLTMASVIKLYRVPSETVTRGLRPLTQDDVQAVNNLLSTYLAKFSLYVHFTDEEFAHWLLPREGVITSYVVENDGVITDFFSFYTLCSTIIGNVQYQTLRAAYSYYNVATVTPLNQLIQDALIIAKQLDFDVFNALDVMENMTFLKELKFGIGDGHLQYYLYNWKCPEMEPGNVALVLL